MMPSGDHSVQSTPKSATNTVPVYDEKLSDHSAKDAAWDRHRAYCDQVAEIFEQETGQIGRWGERMSACSGWLSFGRVIERESGESRLKLREARLCRVRSCPVCQWRESLLWKHRFYTALPKLAEQYPNHRWLFLTLTVRNPPIGELRDTVSHMNKSWQRLIQRKAVKSMVDGWVRSTEVTKPADPDYCHPHFHVLLMVKPSYFKGKNYIKQSKWRELWQSCLQVGYEPSVDIRTVKAAKGVDATEEALRSAVKETLKYTVKEADMVDDPEWMKTLAVQRHRLRFMASGGALKDFLNMEDEASNDDLILLTDEDGNESEDDGSRIAFNWRPEHKQYRRNPRRDVAPKGPDRYTVADKK